MRKGEAEALHDTYCAGYHNLPRMVKRHLSLHDMQEIWFHMVRPVVDTLTAELESLKQQVPHYAIDTAKINDLQKVAIHRIVERAKHAHLTDIHMRINGEWTVEEGDWIKHISLPPEPQGVDGE